MTIWTPSEISTDLWIDATDSTVGSLDVSDLSGNGRTCSAATSGAMPAVITDGLNGVPVFRFDGGDTLTASSKPSDTCSVFWLQNIQSDTFYIPFSPGSSSYALCVLSGGGTPVSSGSGTISFRHNGSAASWSSRDAAYDQLTTGPCVVAALGIDVSSWASFGISAWGSAMVTGDFGTILVVPGTPDSDTIEQIEGYLAWRFGIQTSLPVDHTYYSAAPLTTVETPLISLPDGEYSVDQEITITCGTPSSTIHYTEDGSEPTTSSTEYTGAITLSASKTIKAIAVATGAEDSAVASTLYNVPDLPETISSFVYTHSLACSMVGNVVKDFGVDSFGSTDFVHTFKFGWKELDTLGMAVPYQLTADTSTLDDFVRIAGYGSALQLDVVVGGSVLASEVTASITAQGSPIYVTVTYDADGGTGGVGQIKAEFRADSHTSTVLDTLTVDYVVQPSYRYHAAFYNPATTGTYGVALLSADHTVDTISQDLSTYVITDPNSKIVVEKVLTSSEDLQTSLAVADVVGPAIMFDYDAGTNSYAYLDSGADYYNGDFTHDITVATSWGSTDDGRWPGVWALSNTVGNSYALETSAEDFLLLHLEKPGGAWPILYIKEYVGGVLQSSDVSISLGVGSTWYVNVTRDESIGTYGRLTVTIYSDSAKTTVVDTIYIDLSQKTDFRYRYNFISHDNHSDKSYGFVAGPSTTLSPLLPTAQPAILPSSGEYAASQEITITCSTPGSTIYYTEDGTEPTESSTEYTAPFALTSTKTIKAIAVASGLIDSAVASVTYTVVENLINIKIGSTEITAIYIGDIEITDVYVGDIKIG